MDNTKIDRRKGALNDKTKLEAEKPVRTVLQFH